MNPVLIVSLLVLGYFVFGLLFAVLLEWKVNGYIEAPVYVRTSLVFWLWPVALVIGSVYLLCAGPGALTKFIVKQLRGGE